jgi:hypothetical protein
VSKREFEAPEEFKHRGQLNEDLQGAAGDRSPRGDDDQGVLRATRAEGDHSDDHGDVPEHGSRVREEEPAVTVEDTEAPGGGDEEPGTGEQNADEEDGKFALFAVEAGRDCVDEPGRCEHAEKHEE